ncbi:MAG: copper chaperone PCu(A)C [Ilumatobacter sp.]
MTRSIAAPLLAGALAFGAAACGSDDASSDAGSGDTTEEAVAAGITIEDPWVREPADGQTLAAGYATITNGTDEAITLIGASAPITATFEIHETSMDDDGVMSMAEKEGGFEIAPGDSFTLEPGGPHVMMLNIDATEFEDALDLTYVFDAAEVTVAAEIRAIGDSMEGMDMDEMDHSDMDMEDSEG